MPDCLQDFQTKFWSTSDLYFDEKKVRGWCWPKRPNV